jgi:UDP-glucose 4-epimerase
MLKKMKMYGSGMKIIITGGSGYIGSHTAVEEIRAGHEVVILDPLLTLMNTGSKTFSKAHGLRRRG